MLFADFFPRLQADALRLYGQAISERQFRDWREDGLIAGPAKPIGQGRGRSPHRHWPLASYRRALRLCRYKSRGNYRISQWWIGLWLAGDEVDHDILKAALEREFTFAKRQSRHLSDGRWRNGPFSRVDEIERGGASAARGIAALLELSPEQFRLGSIQQFEEPTGQEDVTVIHDLASKLFAMDLPDPPSAEEIRVMWRAGHMGDGPSYLAKLEATDLALAREITLTARQSPALQWASGLYIGEMDLGRMSLFLFAAYMSSPFRIGLQVDGIFQTVFGIVVDSREGLDPSVRLATLRKSNTVTVNALADLTPDEIIAGKRRWLHEAARNTDVSEV